MASSTPVTPPRVNVLTVKTLTEGNLRAIASVQIGPLVIHGCRVVQQPGQAAWTSAPQSEWTDAAGKKKYKSILEWPREWGQAITQAIEAELKDHPEGTRRMEAATPLGREVQQKAGVGGSA